MRVPATMMLAAGLTLCSGQTAAQQEYSADGLYNVANAYARAGRPGLAVLNYERALLLAPGDADIRTNLDQTRARAHVPTQTRSGFVRMVEAASPAIAAWIGVLGVALVGTALLAMKRAPRLRWLSVAGLLPGVALMAFTVSHAVLLRPRLHEAVILVNQTPARVTPALMGDTAFVLPEAETVTITAEHEDFILVRNRSGHSGWVARASLGIVVPQVSTSPPPSK
jgi:hypothetical protein